MQYWIKYKYKPISKKVIDIDNVVNYIKLLLDNDKFISIREIVNCLFKKFKQHFSRNFVYTIIVRKLK